MTWWQGASVHPLMPGLGFFGLAYLPYNVLRLRRATTRADRVYRSQLWKGNAFSAVLLLYHPDEVGNPVAALWLFLGLWYLCSALPMRLILKKRAVIEAGNTPKRWGKKRRA